MRRFALPYLLFFLLSSEWSKGEDDKEIPSPMREFRAAWVATVHNVDWPSKAGLTVREMQNEAVAILDRLEQLNMNAVIFQVRPNADALYESKIEPWSYCLTGTPGQAPEAGFDPLKFWVAQAHLRGMQLHAWFNPYRAIHHLSHGPFTDLSIQKTNPELVVQLKRSGYWWVNPAAPGAIEYTIDVVMDVVNRYDIDGVHFDDYFYPYPKYNNNRDFPDAEAFRAYQENCGGLSLKDWRREAVNSLISELSAKIKAAKSHVEFGISPFGIWRPGYPEGVSGLDQYDVLYADARKWLRNGWVDYMMPQLYWPVDSEKQSFPALLSWWDQQNYKKKHLWPGMKITTSEELVNQIGVTRMGDSEYSGMCLFSSRNLMDEENSEAEDALKGGPWSERALIPVSPWLNLPDPVAPKVSMFKDAINRSVLEIDQGESEYFQLVLNEKRYGKWQPARIVPGMLRMYTIEPGVEAVALRGVNRHRKMSRTVVVDTRPGISSKGKEKGEKLVLLGK